MHRSSPNLLRLFLVLILGTVAGCAAVATEDEACDRLLEAAGRYQLAGQSVPPGRYYCDVAAPNASGYYQLGLRYADDPQPDWVGSDLVGWYAVRRSDGQVFTWDIAEDARGEPVTD